MTPRVAWLLIVPALAPAAWLSCNAIAGIDEPIVVPSDCEHQQPPVAPKVEDTGSMKLVFALHNVAFGHLDGATTVPAGSGYDLDQTCTCPGEPSCKAIFSDTRACDQPGGSDNGFLSLYNAFGILMGMDHVNEVIDRGDFGFLFRIEDYNGKDNDPLVSASFYSASRAAMPDGGLPVWSGWDTWNIDGRSFVSADVPRFVDKAAYVRNGVLVSRLAQAQLVFPLFSTPLQFDVSDAVVTARIAKGDGGIYTLSDGQFAGRIPVDSLLRTAAQLPYAAEPQLCLSEPGYSAVRAETCRRADIHSKSGGSPAARCDALSFVLGFDAVQASFGVAEILPWTEPGICPATTSYDCEGLGD